MNPTTLVVIAVLLLILVPYAYTTGILTGKNQKDQFDPTGCCQMQQDVDWWNILGVKYTPLNETLRRNWAKAPNVYRQ